MGFLASPPCPSRFINLEYNRGALVLRPYSRPGGSCLFKSPAQDLGIGGSLGSVAPAPTSLHHFSSSSSPPPPSSPLFLLLLDFALLLFTPKPTQAAVAATAAIASRDKTQVVECPPSFPITQTQREGGRRRREGGSEGRKEGKRRERRREGGLGGCFPLPPFLGYSLSLCRRL